MLKKMNDKIPVLLKRNTKIEKEFSLLKRYDWECHPIFPKPCENIL